MFSRRSIGADAEIDTIRNQSDYGARPLEHTHLASRDSRPRHSIRISGRTIHTIMILINISASFHKLLHDFELSIRSNQVTRQRVSYTNIRSTRMHKRHRTNMTSFICPPRYLTNSSEHNSAYAIPSSPLTLSTGINSRIHRHTL